MSTLQQPETSGIRDNYLYGSVGAFLKEKIVPGSTLSVVSAYFTIYAYDLLREQLNPIGRLRFLFGEPRFLKTLDPAKTDKKAFKIEDDGLQLANRLEQRRVQLFAAAQESAPDEDPATGGRDRSADRHRLHFRGPESAGLRHPDQL